MNISKLKELKKKSQMTNQQIAELSGIPLDIISKIFSCELSSPDYSILLAVEEVLTTKTKIPFSYDQLFEKAIVVKEPGVPYKFRSRNYTLHDIEKLPEGVLAELIDGKLFIWNAPSRIHQSIVTQLIFHICTHIHNNRGTCQVFPAPFGVRLLKNEDTLVLPDISVICNPDILNEHGCDGAPDWIIEIASKSNYAHDYITKFAKYQKAGVKEYWIIDPEDKKILVYNFLNPAKTNTYNITDKVPSNTLDGLVIELNNLS